MPDTARLGLPLMAAAQAQKHVTHNDALISLDALAQIGVIDAGPNAPPATPGEGDLYIVGPNPTGTFLGQSGRLALFVSGAWRFFPPKSGWLSFVASSQKLLVHNGAQWRAVEDVQKVFSGLTALGVGTAPDATNALAVKSNSALFTAKAVAEGGTGDLRLVLNKEKASATLSQLYQTAWSGRAETGLSGDDKWRLKVSADGSAWREALLADPATGAVRIDTLLAGRAVPGFVSRQEIEFTGPAGVGLTLNDTGTGTNTAIGFRRAGTVVGFIAMTGTGVALNTTSDYRLKTDLQPLPDPLGLIARLKVWRYRFKAAPQDQVDGFLAHELAEVIPAAVQGEKDAVDANGEAVFQSIDFARLIPVLTAALQTLSVRVQRLEGK